MVGDGFKAVCWANNHKDGTQSVKHARASPEIVRFRMKITSASNHIRKTRTGGLARKGIFNANFAAPCIKDLARCLYGR